MTPLVIADTGGQLGTGDAAVPVQRTLLTGRSIELDALAVADGRTSTSKTDLMIGEMFRHDKAIGVWGTGSAVLDHAGVPADGDGVVVAAGPSELIAQLTALLTHHRVWAREG
jgi:catalase